MKTLLYNENINYNTFMKFQPPINCYSSDLQFTLNILNLVPQRKAPNYVQSGAAEVTHTAFEICILPCCS